ncbi:MAG: sulfite reductase [Desulfobacca sp.]|jgi:dissimilatory sulfite reductase (desulfoviridin) alpha/beta subunit|nr:sulfite reductase [Desulfobacca sp.]
MKWTQEAEEAVSRVPFFVRKRVRKKVEEEAERFGEPVVTLEHVRNSQKRFLNEMDREIKGFQVETCFGPSGCPNRAMDCDGLAQALEQELTKRDLKAFLRARVQGPLKMHHEFRVSLSCCPNACSRPQIVDFGIIGVRHPRITDETCTQCGACIEACKEEAIHLDEAIERPTIDFQKCLSCGQCIPACPTGTLQEDTQGFRVLVGGKLGRHPQLGKDLGKIHSKDEMLRELNHYLDLYQTHSRKGERLGKILNRVEG